MLARRLELLREVGRLQESLGVPGDVSYTCETAGHFFLYQVRTEILLQRLYDLNVMKHFVKLAMNFSELRVKAKSIFLGDSQYSNS